MQDATNRAEAAPGRPSWPTAPEPIGREAIRRVQREKILRALVDLVSKRGYRDTSTERICRQAVVSLPTFRGHFADKEEAFLAAFDEAVVAGEKRVMAAVAAVEGDWASRIEAGLSALLAFIEEDPARARLCLVESLTAGPAGFDRYETTVRLCEPGLSLGRREVGGEPELPPLLEETIAGGVAWAIHHEVANGEAGQASRLLGQLLETTLRPYLGEAEARRHVELASARRMNGAPEDPTKAQIERAIVELVGSRGYEETTVAMIVERAGVSEADFERNFSGKSDCFLAVLEELRQEYLELNAAAFATGKDWQDGLRRAAYAAYDWFREDPARARFMAVESLNAGDRSAALLDEGLNLLAELVHAGRFELEDPDSVPRTAAESAVGSIWNLLVTRIRSGKFDDEEEVVPQLMFFAVLPYKGEAAARAELRRPRNGENRE